MRRRLFLPTLLCLPLLAQADSEPEADDAPAVQPQYKVSLATLQAAVGQRFPFRYPVPGLVNLDVQLPQLRLLPAQNRLGAEMQVDAAGPALNRSHQGLLDVEFALRYEATDRTVRAHQLRLKRLQFPSLPPAAMALLRVYGPALAERTLLEVVVHRMRPQDLALPDGLGMQPGSITVTETGLTIGFVPKPWP
ncbi:DUF1439 domain-containing protein [uncultured Rhodoferax sp.]|uniref:DUF1439 domain-containing protein n=1 Tax=uncultured Rhodoferax sp. TaxID=223188 RepID=UPI0025CE89F7|nr:DUF1439 domain-containing protein [uncultured Rhodoferax sp.]